MLAVRRLFSSRKTLANYISTSSIVRCKKSEEGNTPESNNTDIQKQEKHKDLPSEKTVKKKHGNKKQFKLSRSDLKIEQPQPESSSSSPTESSSSSPPESSWSSLVQVEGKQGKIKKRTKKQETKQELSEREKEPEFQTEFFRKILAPSVEKVAEEVGGEKGKTREDLLQYIQTFEVTNEFERQPMRLRPRERFKAAGETPSDTFLGSLLQNENGLNIFPANAATSERFTKNQIKLNIWDELEKEHLEYWCQLPPRNHFEEQIQWTNEGKLWHFPIDNDQGREEEAKVSFTEHIFLEKHLEPWCPKKGPIRKFMELVLIGLSKNPYLTLADKREHIDWFKAYFERKKKLLMELGAMGTTKELGEIEKPTKD